MSSYLEVRQLCQRFTFNDGETEVLEKISFSLEKGEFLCIMGASGCGKTTLLRCLAGFLTPTNGEILIDGNLVTNPGRYCSMVFQTFDQLLPWKTVLGNVIYPLLVNKDKKHTRSEAGKIAQEYLELVGLAQYMNYYPHQLSGGMKQRVAIARSLVQQPSLILMDEPFASLDADTRAILQKELLHIWKESGVTVLFVTHSILEAIALGSKIMVLGNSAEGVKLFMDNPVEGKPGIPRTPQTPYFAECWTKLSTIIRQEPKDTTEDNFYGAI